jgi:hypothetical protein
MDTRLFAASACLFSLIYGVTEWPVSALLASLMLYNLARFFKS